ncbi:MAG: Calx-beta domain-containing protein [Gammaproteobacteria bacterium]
MTAPADDEDDLGAFHDLNEQFSRGELELDKVLQRLVKVHSPASTHSIGSDISLSPPRIPAEFRGGLSSAAIAEELTQSPVAADLGEFPAPTATGHLGPKSPRVDRLIWLLTLSGLLALNWFLWRNDPSVSSQPSRPSPAVARANTTPVLPVAASASTDGPQAPKSARPEAAPVAPPRAVPAKPPTVGFASGSRVIVSESTRFITLKVRSTGRLREPVELSVTAIGGAARVNEDFVPPVEHLFLSSQHPTADVLVSLLADDIPENVEDFSVVLRVVKGNATLSAGRVLVVLNDDD